MKTFRLSALIIIVFAFSGCATSQKIQVVQAGDNNLSCEQLTQELSKLEQSEQAINDNKGVTGTNVAAAYSSPFH